MCWPSRDSQESLSASAVLRTPRDHAVARGHAASSANDGEADCAPGSSTAGGLLGVRLSQWVATPRSQAIKTLQPRHLHSHINSRYITEP